MENNRLINQLSKTAEEHPSTSLNRLLKVAVKNFSLTTLAGVSDRALFVGLQMIPSWDPLTTDRPARQTSELNRLIDSIEAGWHEVGVPLGNFLAGFIEAAGSRTPPQDQDSMLLHLLHLDAETARSVRG